MDIDFDYQLESRSVVFDVGGYEGEFTDAIRRKYGCGVHVFEPAGGFFAGIVKRFREDPLVWPYNVALEDINESRVLDMRGNSTSLYQSPEKLSMSSEIASVRDIGQFVEAFHLDRIDLLKLNCEGSEYRILSRLHAMDWIKRVRHIVVQFHEIPGWGKDAFERIFRITHQNMHRCEHWQWWKRNSL